LCTRVINFVNLTKQGKDSVESHSTKWAEEMRQLELQGMSLPAIFQCCLFLMSLGPQFNMFTAAAAMGTDADFKLDRLMAKASDFQGKHDVDEARDAARRCGAKVVKPFGPGEHGSKEEQATKGPASTTVNLLVGAPYLCSKGWHPAAQCFAPGAGLAHLNREERREWLEDKHTKRSAESNPTQAQGGATGGSTANSGSAHLANGESSATDQLEALQAKFEDLKGKMNDMGFEYE
jgi:hypothetical protein